MEIQWESEVAQLLSQLGATQEKLLRLLSRKRELLIERDCLGLASLVEEEEVLCAELEACQASRQHLLDRAAAAGLPADSILSLTSALPPKNAEVLHQPLDDALKRSHVLRHQCVAQWVVVQRTLLHLSHMLEIIATGGQGQPTYGKDGVAEKSGALMDQAV